MDPVTLATITAGVSVLASECAKGVAGEAGKDLWTRIKKRLGFQQEPELPMLAPAVAQKLSEDESAAKDVIELLRNHASAAPTAAAMIGQINAERVVVLNNQTVQGNFTFGMGA
jgi:hypothetical protein